MKMMAQLEDDAAYSNATHWIASFCRTTVPTAENSRLCPQLNKRLFLLDCAKSLPRLDEHHYVRFVANKKTFTFRQMGDTGEWTFHYTKLLDQLPRETSVKSQLLDFLVDCDDYDYDSMAETCMKLAVDRGYIQFFRRLPTVEHISQFLKCYAGSLTQEVNLRNAKQLPPVPTTISTPSPSAESPVPDISLPGGLNTSFNQTKLDNSLVQLLSSANPTAENSQIKKVVPGEPGEEKLFFKIKWVKFILPPLPRWPLTVAALTEYLRHNDKFIVNEDCARVTSVFVKIATEEALLKKVDHILDVCTESASVQEIHSKLGTSYRLRVNSVAVLARFLGGHPSKYQLASNVVHRIAIPESSGSISTVTTINSDVSHPVEMKENVFDLENVEQQPPVATTISAPLSSAASPVPAISLPEGANAFFNPKKFDNDIFNILYSATPTPENSRIKNVVLGGRPEEGKLLFKVSWVKLKLPFQLTMPPSVTALTKYLSVNDKFIVIRGCVHATSVIDAMPTEEVMLKKVDEIFDVCTAGVTLQEIYSLLSTSFRLRVCNVLSLQTFIEGYPSKYKLASNVVRRAAIPEPLGLSSSSIKAIDSTVSHIVKKKEDVVNIGNMIQQTDVLTKILIPFPSAASTVPAISEILNVSFNTTKLDNVIVNILSCAIPTEENSRIKRIIAEGKPDEEKLFFKISWVNLKRPLPLPMPLSNKALREYLLHNDKFIVNQNCVHVVSIIAEMPSEEALLKKVNDIIEISTASVSLQDMHSLLSNSFRLRVRSVPALKMFLAGYPSNYQLASNVVHCVEIAEPSESSSRSSTIDINSAPSQTVEKKEKSQSTDMHLKLVQFVVYLMLNKLAVYPDKKWFELTWLLLQVKVQFNTVTEDQLKYLLLKSEFFSGSTSNQVCLKDEEMFPKEDLPIFKSRVIHILNTRRLHDVNTLTQSIGDFNYTNLFSIKWLAGQLNHMSDKVGYFKNALLMKKFLLLFPQDFMVIGFGVLLHGTTVKKVSRIQLLNPQEEEALISTLACQLLNMMVFGMDVPIKDILLNEHAQLYRNSATLMDVANKYPDMFLVVKPKTISMYRPIIPPSCHKILKNELKQILSGSTYSQENNGFKLDEKTGECATGFLFSWVAEELIRRKSVIVLKTPVAVEALNAFVSERTEVFWTVDNCVNLINRVNEESPISQLHMDSLVRVLENSAIEQRQCYIGQGMKLFWCQSWVRKMLPDLPWNQAEGLARLSNSTLMIDSGLKKGIGLAQDAFWDPINICKRELVTGRILQLIGEEFGLILANGKIISFIVNCVCDAGKYVNENYDVREHIYVGKQVQAVVDYTIKADQIPMAISVSTDGKLDVMRPISLRLQLLLKSKFHEVMREEWLATLPNGARGRFLREALLKYIALNDLQALEKWMSTPVFRSHVVLKNESLVFDETLPTSFSTLLRLILPENKALMQLQCPTKSDGNYTDLPLPIMSNTLKMTSTPMGSLSLVGVIGSVWRKREADGVEIIITAPDIIMFSVLYANSDERLGPMYASLVVGSIVTFNLSASEISCGAIIPLITNLKVSLVNQEIAKASESVLAGKARYVGHLDTAKVAEIAEEAQDDHMLVLDDIPITPPVDVIVCDVRDTHVIANPSTDVENQVVQEDIIGEKDSASKCVLS